MTSSLDVKPFPQWTPDEVRDMAELIVEPLTNGGMASDVTAEQVAAQFPLNTPAWGVWVEGRPVFVVGLWPFNAERGCLHLAGDRTLNHEQHVSLVRAFLSCMEGVEVFTTTSSPALVRLARQVGLSVTGQVTTYALGRANPEQ